MARSEGSEPGGADRRVGRVEYPRFDLGRDEAPRNLCDQRLALEPVAARLAAPALRKDASALEKNIEAASKASSLIKVTHLDLDFHEIILEVCGNARLLKLWRSIRGELERAFRGSQEPMDSRDFLPRCSSRPCCI